ncbi:MAG: hypothetical protein KatS3mg061_3405 [Dehalococcoidia bacterium]|nr:MAG: hypothetical protein KatS3mg061_3405 [Dehalococcoidia bacterium]
MKLSLGTTLWRTQGEHDRYPKAILEDWHPEIEHLLWQARAADQAGFENLWLTEHHFSHHSSASAPSVILAHLAAITRRIGLGYGIALLPMHHPILLAEEMLWVDHLSTGRLRVGVGRGHTPIEFAAFGIPHERDREYFLEALTILTTALRGEPVEFQGTIWQTPRLYLTPGPYQRPSPPLHMVTTSEWSMRQAVRFRAAPILGIDPPATLKRQLAQFRAFAAEEGLSEEETAALLAQAKCTRRIVVSESRAEAEEEVARGMAEADEAWFRYSQPVGDPALFAPWTPASPDRLRQGWRSETPGKDFAHIIAGTPAEVVEQLRALEAETDIHHVSTSVSNHGIRRAFAEQQMRLFAEQVIPHL